MFILSLPKKPVNIFTEFSDESYKNNAIYLLVGTCV